jgi:hypothetical protein
VVRSHGRTSKPNATKKIFQDYGKENDNKGEAHLQMLAFKVWLDDNICA